MGKVFEIFRSPPLMGNFPLCFFFNPSLMLQFRFSQINPKKIERTIKICFMITNHKRKDCLNLLFEIVTDGNLNCELCSPWFLLYWARGPCNQYFILRNGGDKCHRPDQRYLQYNVFPFRQEFPISFSQHCIAKCENIHIIILKNWFYFFSQMQDKKTIC